MEKNTSGKIYYGRRIKNASGLNKWEVKRNINLFNV